MRLRSRSTLSTLPSIQTARDTNTISATDVLPNKRERCDSIDPTTGKTFTLATKIVERELNIVLSNIVYKFMRKNKNARQQDDMERLRSIVKPEVSTIYSQLAWLSKHGCRVDKKVKRLVTLLIQTIKQDVHTPEKTMKQAKDSLESYDTKGTKYVAHRQSTEAIIAAVLWDYLSGQSQSRV